MTEFAIAAHALETRMLNAIPATRALGLHVASWDGLVLSLAAPLAPNINDKGCAFGGSMTSLMTLAGWAFTNLAMEADGAATADIFVATSTVAYKVPVWHDFHADATPAPDADLAAFLARYAERGKARLPMRVRLFEDDGSTVCATLAADFVAKRREPVTDTGA